MKWTIQNNIISELTHKSENLILPWGMETADSSSFFSLESGIGWRYKTIKSESFSDEKVHSANQIVKMKEGSWELKIKESLEGLSLRRKITASCLENCLFMDFVLRFRFKKKLFHRAHIADEIIEHTNSNIYHQHPVDHVTLEGDQHNITVKILKSSVPANMTSVMYVRDSLDEWVVHARMIPLNPAKEVIKLCSPIFQTRPIPQSLSNLVLKIPAVRKKLWYRTEMNPSKNLLNKIFNPNAYAMAHVPKDEILMWDVVTTLHD